MYTEFSGTMQRSGKCAKKVDGRFLSARESKQRMAHIEGPSLSHQIAIGMNVMVKNNIETHLEIKNEASDEIIGIVLHLANLQKTEMLLLSLG
ncbi:hypothetical protein M413DRAFT_438278 [Hebeloma cylindrosporum]|uniref:Uncharacterized protein n=1 Tax=Hebeloma cylindrosporum TaxID=76867 RepID=A0A0C3CYB5_HEBCY|nr:hypothetical protein M413DRAFT_438278 [Hebeloma cylindrosporum h7]